MRHTKKKQKPEKGTRLNSPIESLNSSKPQTKLKIGAPNDKYEQQADAVADAVVANPSPAAVQTMPMEKEEGRQMMPMETNTMQMVPEEEESVQMIPEDEESVQMMPEDEESVQMMPEDEEVQMMSEDEESVQMMSEDEEVQMMSEDEEVQAKPGIQKSADGSSQASSALASQLGNSKGGGQSLPSNVQREMGHKIGVDFSGVKIHNNSQSAEMSDSIGARAFTHGNNIYFNKGEYDTSSKSGKHLLAHELTHTVQQGGSKNSINSKQMEHAPLNVLQREVKSEEVTWGEFTLDMDEKATSSGGSIGLDGDIKFMPNEEAPTAQSIRMLQVAKLWDSDASAEFSWAGTAEEDRNTVQTSAESKTYTTVKGDTLNSISESQSQGHVTAKEIYNANSSTLTSSTPTTVIPEKTNLSLPKVKGGYGVDIWYDPKSERSASTDAEVNPYYEGGTPIVGYKKSKSDRKEASINDWPKTGRNAIFSFESVARDPDKGTEFGTVYWGFTVDASGATKTTKDKTFRVEEGTSDTFKASLQEHTEFFKNHHMVVKGDTLWSLAVRYLGDGQKWKEIRDANGLPNDKVRKGQKLKIPGVTA